jgi:hypothetical protein
MAADARDVARFDATDDAAIVEASLCCSFCLGRVAFVIVGAGDEHRHACCYCAICDAHTEVSLNSDQLLRLALAPPRGIRIRIVAEDEPCAS